MEERRADGADVVRIDHAIEDVEPVERDRARAGPRRTFAESDSASDTPAWRRHRFDRDICTRLSSGASRCRRGRNIYKRAAPYSNRSCATALELGLRTTCDFNLPRQRPTPLRQSANSG